MFDFIPVAIYTNVQYFIILGIILVILLYAMTGELQNPSGLQSLNTFGWFFVVIFTLYMGLRQVHWVFGDTFNYNKAYQRLLEGQEITITKDYLFNYMMVFSSKFMSVNSFFLLVDVLYIVPVVLFSRKYFGSYWFIAFIMFAGSFSFWSYGVNGLRNGLGTALFILALYFYDRKWLMYLCLGMSYFMHASLMIPIAAFILSGLYKNPKIYLIIWVASIPLSLAGGSTWSNFFSSLGFAEDRTQGYLTGGEEFMDQFSQTGFRWDFLIYSASAVYIGWFFIFKKKITDPLYIHIFGVYCITNAFWILVITAAFSNRFAYLSWFLMPVVFAYPMFRYKIWDNQYKTFSVILLLYFMFTFYMNVIK